MAVRGGLSELNTHYDVNSGGSEASQVTFILNISYLALLISVQ